MIYPKGTVLHEENNIKYQIYSDEYYETTKESIIESRIAEGTVYADFGIDRSFLELSTQCLVEKSTIRIIAVDTTLDIPKVIGQIFAEDFTTFVEGQNQITGVYKLDILKKLNKKLIKPMLNVNYDVGDIVIGSGYGVRKEYQNQKIGNNLSMLFLSVCLDSPYKIFCGLFYSQKASSIMCKNGGFIMCQLRIEDCFEFDNQINTYMKNHIEIVSYIDSNKDSQHFQCLKSLKQNEQNSTPIEP